MGEPAWAYESNVLSAYCFKARWWIHGDVFFLADVPLLYTKTPTQFIFIFQ